MNLHPHSRLETDGVSIRAGGDRDGLPSGHGDGRFHVSSLILIIAVEVGAEVQSLAVELLKRRGKDERKAHDLVRDQLLLKGGPGLGTVVHDAGRVTTVIAVGRAVIARIRIMKYFHHDPFQRFSPLHSRDVRKPRRRHLLERPLDHLTSVAPPATLRIREIFIGVGNRLDFRSRNSRAFQTGRKSQRPCHQ